MTDRPQTPEGGESLYRARELRPSVMALAYAMEAKLRKHDPTRGDKGWIGDSAESLLVRLREEVDELERAVEAGGDRYLPDARRVLSEAADVANFELMVADVEGGLIAGEKEADRSPAPEAVEALRELEREAGRRIMGSDDPVKQAEGTGIMVAVEAIRAALSAPPAEPDEGRDVTTDEAREALNEMHGLSYGHGSEVTVPAQTLRNWWSTLTDLLAMCYTMMDEPMDAAPPAEPACPECGFASNCTDPEEGCHRCELDAARVEINRLAAAPSAETGEGHEGTVREALGEMTDDYRITEKPWWREDAVDMANHALELQETKPGLRVTEWALRDALQRLTDAVEAAWGLRVDPRITGDTPSLATPVDPPTGQESCALCGGTDGGSLDYVCRACIDSPCPDCSGHAEFGVEHATLSEAWAALDALVATSNDRTKAHVVAQTVLDYMTAPQEGEGKVVGTITTSGRGSAVAHIEVEGRLSHVVHSTAFLALDGRHRIVRDPTTDAPTPTED